MKWRLSYGLVNYASTADECFFEGEEHEALNKACNLAEDVYHAFEGTAPDLPTQEQIEWAYMYMVDFYDRDRFDFEDTMTISVGYNRAVRRSIFYDATEVK